MDKKTTPSPEQPSLFDRAGEVLSGIGHKISDATETVVGFVSDEAVVVRKAKQQRKLLKKLKRP